MFPSFPHLELLYFTFNHIFVQAGNVNEKGEDAQMVKRWRTEEEGRTTIR